MRLIQYEDIAGAPRSEQAREVSGIWSIDAMHELRDGARCRGGYACAAAPRARCGGAGRLRAGRAGQTAAAARTG